MGDDNFLRDLVVFLVILIVVLILVGLMFDGYDDFSPSAELWKGVA